MSTSPKAKKLEELTKNLFNPDESIALKALETINEIGSAEIVPSLISLYASSTNPDVRREAGNLLSTLKISGAEQHLTAALKNPSFRHIRKDIIGFIWSSGIQPVDDLDIFTSIAIEGSFEEALECITLLDSLETAVPEAVLLESIAQLKQYLGKNEKNEKRALLVEYLMALENLRIEE